jgi:murein L,D-transpeptidase YcbB/YkuD
MPNSFDVYLHDTNHKNLFNEPRRAFSSGCVRINRAFALAAYLLTREGWEDGFLEKSLNSGETVNVNLKLVLPIYLTYFTAWVDDTGAMNFRDDIYGWDKALLTALDSRAPVSISASKRTD